MSRHSMLGRCLPSAPAGMVMPSTCASCSTRSGSAAKPEAVNVQGTQSKHKYVRLCNPASAASVSTAEGSGGTILRSSSLFRERLFTLSSIFSPSSVNEKSYPETSSLCTPVCARCLRCSSVRSHLIVKSLTRNRQHGSTLQTSSTWQSCTSSMCSVSALANNET